MTITHDERLTEYAEMLLAKYAKGRLDDEKFDRLMTKLAEWADYNKEAMHE